jgi:hypothetical protein
MATLINAVNKFFKKNTPAAWYSRDEQNRFYREMEELRREFYRQGF